MSAEIRKQLAAAASTVEGVTCSPYYLQLAQIGQACVREDHVDYDRFGSIVHWNVIVGLGQDMAAAEAFWETTRPLLVAALRPVMAPEKTSSAQQQQLRLTDGTTVLAGFINGFREE